MKKLILLSSIITTLYCTSYAQNAVKTYYFKGDFQEETQSAPALVPICEGAFANSFLPDYNLTRQAYNFEENCGFSYNDSTENFISSGSYSIALYFKMNELDSWKRVIDFKSRTTDRGCYVYYGQLNFYNIVTSTGSAPFYTDSFSHYVITRDATTKKVEMYGDGNKFISFIDGNDDAVYDASKTLRFFQDDLVVSGEASAGTVALLKIYNYAMDSVNVKSEYDNLGNDITSIKTPTAQNVARVFPNPTSNILNISIPENSQNSSYQLLDIYGKNLMNGLLYNSTSKIDIGALSKGFYFLHIQIKGKTTEIKKVVKL